MISRTIIDLLSDEGEDLPIDETPRHIDDTFVLHRSDEELLAFDSGEETQLSTRKKLNILDWASMDRQLRSYGFSKIDDLSLKFIDEDARRHVATGSDPKSAPTKGFDFRSDSIPFAVKYNVAIALSYSEAIDILSKADTCEIYASEEVKTIFEKHGRHIYPGLSRINFDELPLDMKKDLVWPMVQNLYRGLIIRKAAQIFPEGVSGELAYKALLYECENKQLAGHISPLTAIKYTDSERVYFSDLSELEEKYHVALYCLNHVGEIKPARKPSQEEKEEEPTGEDRQQHEENIRTIEEEYISAFKRLNKSKSFWDKINLRDLFEMGQDVILAIKEEVKNFARLKQEIISRLAGRSKVAIENEELLRIARCQNPDFGFVSQYLAMFFQPSNYYDILGIDSARTVTEKDVKDAFKRQAKIYHPDKNPNDPNKHEKEQIFKLLITAKDALLRKLGSGKEIVSDFREDVSPAKYLGNISKLFADYAFTNQDKHCQEEAKRLIDEYQDDQEEEVKVESDADYTGEISNPFEYSTGEDQDASQYQGEAESSQTQEEIQREPDVSNTQEVAGADQYLGPYFEEMRVLGSMIDNWAGKNVLVMGAGRQPDDFSVPVILAQMQANVFAIDANYRGPADYQGCKYFRISADRVDEAFAEEQFDVVISTAMFGVPFTNWSTRQYSLNPFDEGFKDRIRELELEVFGKMFKLTKKGGIHFHYNRDLNPQSWTFTEDDLKYIGYETAFHPQDMPNAEGIWFLRK
jgi:hypothetical protein